MPHILIAESLDKETLTAMCKQHGWQLHMYLPVPKAFQKKRWQLSYQPDIPAGDIEGMLGKYDALVVRPKEVVGEAIRTSMPRLKLIVRGGAGVNSIDLVTAKKCGVVVENTPGQNSISTAEYTFALMMEVLAKRHIKRADADTRAHKEGVPEHYMGTELAGKKIGVIGLGAIGLAVAKRAAAFDMDVHYFSRTQKDVPYMFHNTLNALLKAEPDIICLHAPLTDETHAFFNDDVFSRMKKGTVLINTARPQLVDSRAFSDALKNRIVSTFAIDGDYDLVEPFVRADSEHKGVITHHIADATKQAQEKITKQVLLQLHAFFDKGEEINRVI